MKTKVPSFAEVVLVHFSISIAVLWRLIFLEYVMGKKILETRIRIKQWKPDVFLINSCFGWQPFTSLPLLLIQSRCGYFSMLRMLKHIWKLSYLTYHPFGLEELLHSSLPHNVPTWNLLEFHLWHRAFLINPFCFIFFSFVLKMTVDKKLPGGLYKVQISAFYFHFPPFWSIK